MDLTLAICDVILAEADQQLGLSTLAFNTILIIIYSLLTGIYLSIEKG
jgi:hypothetical protein